MIKDFYVALVKENLDEERVVDHFSTFQDRFTYLLLQTYQSICSYVLC